MRTKDARTIVNLDMECYSAVIQALEEKHRQGPELGPDVARMVTDQILGLVRQAVLTTGAVFDDVFVKDTGDGAILDFPEPETADRFAEALHQISDQQHNQTARKEQQETEQRSFRVGISSDNVDRTPGNVLGPAVVHAARLQTAAKSGEILIDLHSWKHLPRKQQKAYGEVELVSVKDHDEPLKARRRQVVPPANWDWENSDRVGQLSASPPVVPPANCDREPTDRGEPLSAREESLLANVFDSLRSNPIVLLLAQDGQHDRAVLEGILERAALQRETLWVPLPATSKPETDRFFTSIGRHFRSGQIHASIDLEDELDDRLRQGESLFLLVSGFEKASEEGCQQLGAILHARGESHGSKFWAVLSGGEQLAALMYEDSHESMLGAAKRLDWPEADAEDVLAWQQRDYPERSLSRAEAEEVLKLCGGHRGLMREFLDRRARGEPESEAISAVLWPLFSYYESKDEAKRRLCDWLEEDDLGEVVPWIRGDLKRRLYWANALVARDGKLVWRCDAIRDVGRRVLGCQ